MKLEHFLTLYTNVNSKWIKYLNVRPQTIKLSEKNLGRTFDDINQSKILYDTPSQSNRNKNKSKQVGHGLNLKAFAQKRKLEAR